MAQNYSACLPLVEFAVKTPEKMKKWCALPALTPWTKYSQCALQQFLRMWAEMRYNFAFTLMSSKNSPSHRTNDSSFRQQCRIFSFAGPLLIDGRHRRRRRLSHMLGFYLCSAIIVNCARKHQPPPDSSPHKPHCHWRGTVLNLFCSHPPPPLHPSPLPILRGRDSHCMVPSSLRLIMIGGRYARQKKEWLAFRVPRGDGRSSSNAKL